MHKVFRLGPDWHIKLFAVVQIMLFFTKWTHNPFYISFFFLDLVCGVWSIWLHLFLQIILFLFLYIHFRCFSRKKWVTCQQSLIIDAVNKICQLWTFDSASSDRQDFLILLSLVFFGSFDVSVQRMFGEFREFHCCCDIIFSHFIKRLKNFWYVDESPGFSNSEALIFFVFAANILWGSPYCCSNSNLALSYPMPYGCWMFQFPH